MADQANITRRSFFRGMPLAAMAASLPMLANTGPVTAEDRRAFHLAEFKRACEDLDPKIGSWAVWDDDDDGSTRVAAYRVTGRYDGDGVYETGTPNALGNRGRLHVTLRAEAIDGHRAFLVTCPGDRRVLTEPTLNTTIGRKLVA